MSDNPLRCCASCPPGCGVSSGELTRSRQAAERIPARAAGEHSRLTSACGGEAARRQRPIPLDSAARCCLLPRTLSALNAFDASPEFPGDPPQSNGCRGPLRLDEDMRGELLQREARAVARGVVGPPHVYLQVVGDLYGLLSLGQAAVGRDLSAGGGARDEPHTAVEADALLLVERAVLQHCRCQRAPDHKRRRGVCAARAVLGPTPAPRQVHGCGLPRYSALSRWKPTCQRLAPVPHRAGRLTGSRSVPVPRRSPTGA